MYDGLVNKILFLSIFLWFFNVVFFCVGTLFLGNSQHECSLQAREEEKHQTQAAEQAPYDIKNNRTPVSWGGLALGQKGQRELVFVISCGDYAGNRAEQV